MAKEKESDDWTAFLKLDPDEVKKAAEDAMPFDMYAELKDILADPTAQKFFVQHLETEFSRENIDFYDRVQELENEPDPKQQWARLQDVVTTFVPQKAPRQVNVVAHIRSAIMSALEAKNVSETMKGLVAAKREIETLMGRDSLKRFKMSAMWKTMNNTVKLRNKYVEIASEVEHSISLVENNRMGWLCRQMFRHGENYTLSSAATTWLSQQQVAADVTSRRDQVDSVWWGNMKEKLQEDSDSPDDEKDEIEEEEFSSIHASNNLGVLSTQKAVISAVIVPARDEEAERQAKLQEQEAKIAEEKRAKRELEVKQIRADGNKIDEYLRANAKPDFIKLASLVGLAKPSGNPFSGEPTITPPTLAECLPDSEVNDRNRAPSARDRAVSFFPKQKEDANVDNSFQPQSKVCLSAFSSYVQQEFPEDMICIQFLADVHRFVNMDLSNKTVRQAQRLQKTTAVAIYNKFNLTPAMQRSNRGTRQKIAHMLGLDKPKPLAVMLGSSDEDEPPPPQESDDSEEEGPPPPPPGSSSDDEDDYEKAKVQREKLEREKLEKGKAASETPSSTSSSSSLVETEKPAKPEKPSKPGRSARNPSTGVSEVKVEEEKDSSQKGVAPPRAPTRPAPSRQMASPTNASRSIAPPQAPPRKPDSPALSPSRKLSSKKLSLPSARKGSLRDPFFIDEDFDQNLFDTVCSHVRTYLGTIFSQFQEEAAYARMMESYTQEKNELQIKRRHDWEVSQTKRALQAVLVRRDTIKYEIQALEEKEFQQKQAEKALRDAADAEAGRQEEAKLQEEAKKKEEAEAAAAAELAQQQAEQHNKDDSDVEEEMRDSHNLDEDIEDDFVVEERKPINPLDPLAQPEASEAPTFASDLKPSAAPGAWGAALEVVKQMKSVRDKPKGWGKPKQGQEQYKSLVIDLVHPGGNWLVGEEKCHFLVTVDSYSLISKDLTSDPNWSDRFHMDILRTTQFLEIGIRRRDGTTMGVVALSLHDIIKAQNRKKKKLMEQHQAEQARSGKVWVKFDPSEKELQTFRRLQAAEFKTSSKSSVRPAVKLSVFISTSRAVDDNEHEQILDSNKRLNPESGHRFQKDGFDLDLTYLAHNLAVLAAPDGHFKELSRFLRLRHPLAYKVYNLCPEVTYEASQFQGNVVYFPMPYHEPCPLDMILQLVEDLRVWLTSHPQNAALIHCKDGGAASSFVFACYCVFVNQLGDEQKTQKVTVGDAMAWFQKRRLMGLRSMASPSQLRYASHVQSYCSIRHNRALLPGPCHLTIQSIVIMNLPNQKAADVFFAIKCRGREPYLSVAKKMIGTRTQSNRLKFDLSKRPLVISDDVVFKFYRRTALGTSDKMFEFSFHSRYVHLESEKRGKDKKLKRVCRLVLPKSDLDRACKDITDTKFHKKFGVKVSFEPTLTAKALKEYELFHEVIECIPLSFYGAPNQQEAGILPAATFQMMADMPAM